MTVRERFSFPNQVAHVVVVSRVCSCSFKYCSQVPERRRSNTPQLLELCQKAAALARVPPKASKLGLSVTPAKTSRKPGMLGTEFVRSSTN